MKTYLLQCVTMLSLLLVTHCLPQTALMMTPSDVRHSADVPDPLAALVERKLGDFDELNELLVGAMIKLPDASISTNAISVDMTNVRCTDFNVEDIIVNAFQQGGATRLQVSLENIDMVCYLDYKYTFLFTRYGTADLYSYDNRASIEMTFEAPNYNGGTFRPTTSTVTQCSPQVSVDNLDFHGDISAVVLNTVEGLLRGKVEQQANERICQELRSLSLTLFSDTLQAVDRTLEEYISAPPADPLRAEKELVVPENITIVNFQDKKDGTWKQWLDQMLVDAVAFLTKQVDDTVYGTDLNINKLIRDNFLDEKGAFLVEIEEGLTLYEGHDKFLRTLIVLESVKVYGLDTIESFELLEDIGKYTLQNELSFRYLTMEVGIIMGMKPSTQPDSIFVNPEAAQGDIAERITVKFGVDDLKAVASILLAVDEAKLGDVSLGSLLDTENIFSCFLSTLHMVQIPTLSVEVSDMQPPTLEGFVSPGIDRVVSSSVDAAFLMYKSTFLEAAPGFFQEAVGNFLNKIFSENFPVDATVSSQCSPPAFDATEGRYVDFRDLLLTPDDSKIFGGSGTQPYGDVVYTLVSEFKEQFLSKDANGSLTVNGLIRDFLAESSNSTGAMASYDGDVLNSTTSIGVGGFRARLDFRIFDAYVQNLDTIETPIQVLEPVMGEANILNNSISIGVDSKPVRLSAKLLISLSDEENLNIRNEVGVSLDLTSAKVCLLVLLQILEQPFFAVPLRDTLNLNCWLTTILPKTPDAKGIVLEENTISVQDLALSIGCVDCSSPNFDALIDMLYSEDTKVKVVNFMDLLLKSDYLRIATDGFVETASKQCPHTEGYDPDSSWGDFAKEAFGGFGVVGASRDEKANYFNVALAAITLFLILVFVIIRWIAKRRNRVLVDSLPSEAIYCLQLKEEEEREKQAELNSRTQPMFRSPHLPRYVRVLVPFVILLTIGLVLVGHLGVLSTVNVVGQFAGEQYAISEVLEFSFFSAALRTYNNGGVEVAILLFLFTGVWLTKLFTSLALWFISPQYLSVSRRGTVLLWLDVFAKLSLPDIFMLLLAIGALLVFMGGTDETFVFDGDFFSAKLIVVPGVGFYCIIIGQRITRVTSRYLLDCHNEVVKFATRELKQSEEWITRASGRTSETWITEDDEESELSQSVRNHSFTETFEDESNQAHGQVASHLTTAPLGSEVSNDARGPESTASSDDTSRSVKRPIAVALIALTVTSLVVIACVLVPSISIDSKVVWGLLGSGKTFEEAVKEYGMFWMISRILVQSRFVLDSTEDYVGLGFLLALVIVTSLAVPSMKGISFVRRWHQRRQTPRSERATEPRRKVKKRESSTPLRARISSAVVRWFRGNENATDIDNEFLPACKLRAWEDLEVYITAFVVAIWQLGAVAGYAIHVYCYILENVYDIVVYLGLMEKTSPQCYRIQTSSPLFVFIVFMSFFMLLASFLVQAASQYRRTMAQTANEMKGVDTHITGPSNNTFDASRSKTECVDADAESSEVEGSSRTDVTELAMSRSF